jgi:hypothetical protein
VKNRKEEKESSEGGRIGKKEKESSEGGRIGKKENDNSERRRIGRKRMKDGRDPTLSYWNSFTISRVFISIMRMPFAVTARMP